MLLFRNLIFDIAQPLACAGWIVIDDSRQRVKLQGSRGK